MTLERRGHVTPEESIALGNATIDRFNRRLLILAAVTAALLLLLVGWTLLSVADVARDTQRSVQAARAQSAQVAQLLEFQKRADADRQRDIDLTVARIAAEQRRSLVAHDQRTEALLRRTLGLVDEEVNQPANREELVLRVRPEPAAAPGARSPRPVGPPTGTTTRPAPQPAPAPPPCKPNGKSGKCAK